MTAPAHPPEIERLFEKAAKLHQTKKLEAAEAAYRELLQAVPTHVSALTNLGVLHAERGETEEAIRCHVGAIAINPDYADAHYNLGNVYRRTGALEFAAECYRECLRLEPTHESAYFNLGLTAKAQGEFQIAEAAFRAVLVMSPSDLAARLQVGEALSRQGKHADAVGELRKAATEHPEDARAHCNLGLLLLSEGRPKEAQESLQKAMKLKPDYAEAHNAYGLALQKQFRYDDALYHFQQAVTASPNHGEAWCNWAINLAEQGSIAEAIDCLRTAITRAPDSPALHDNLLLLLHSLLGITPEQIRDEHFAWAAKFAPNVPSAPHPHPPHDADRRLRIGYVSADFRTHSVAGRAEVLFRNHDRERFEVFAYSNVAQADETTKRLQSLADHWQPIRELNERRFAACVAADRIDVLIDLSGHLAGNRLLGFAERPAAVQVSLYGYPSTTGLRAMDYRVTDAVSDPPGATEQLWSEELLRMPETGWVYQPPTNAPAIGPLPALSNRAFTFGCLANATKIGDECIAAWAKLIQQAPGARLVLLRGSSQMATKNLLERFTKAGILRERITTVERLTTAKYYEQLSAFDLALDPFPFNGCTTTADALWMGVPVLTVAGTCYASRQGAMQMYALGLPEFVSDSADALPALGKMWMGRRGELAEIRAGLRERISASPLMNGERYTRHLEALLRDAWQKRLEDNK